MMFEHTPEQWQSLTQIMQHLHERGDQCVITQITREGAEQYSYDDLAELSEQVAAGLSQTGVSAGDHVALMADAGPRWIAAAVGILRSGAVVTPLDVQLSDDLARHVLKDSDVRVLFTGSDQAERIDQLHLDNAPKLIILDDNETARGWTRFIDHADSTDAPRVEPDAEDTAALFYTSGTTGRPKGVPLQHRHLLFQLRRLLEIRLVEDGDRVLLPLPTHHVYPFVLGLLGPLVRGLTIVLPHSLTGRQMLRALHEGKVTAIVGIPRLYRAIVEMIEQQARAAGWHVLAGLKSASTLSATTRRYVGLDTGSALFHSLREHVAPHLRICASGGAPLDEELAWQLEGFGWRVAEGYGLTETAPLVSINLPVAADFSSAGQPLDGIDLRIDTARARHMNDDDSVEGDSASGEDSDEEGEILVRGPNVFAGYRNLPDKTEEAFNEDGFFRTGDMGFVDRHGFLHVTGRMSSMLISESGEKVPPEHVESIYVQHEHIEEIGVLQDDGQIVAVVVPDLSALTGAGPEPPDQQTITEFISRAIHEQGEQLPSFQQVSEHVISRDRLPRTRLGKLRRHKLHERYEYLKEHGDQAETENAGPVPPREMNPDDRQLLQEPAARTVWDWLAEQYSHRRLTPDTSPRADLGIDSLEWLDVTLEIAQRTGVQLDEEAIGRIERVRDLLREVIEAGREGQGITAARAIRNPDEALDADQQYWLQPQGRWLSALAGAGRAIDRVVLRSLFELSVSGVEHVPDDGPAILAPNHLSYLDPFAIAAALPASQLARTYWAGAQQVTFRTPLHRAFSRLAQVVPASQQGGVMSSLAFGSSVLKRGNLLVWFPEGQRSPTGEIQPFRAGVGLLLDHLAEIPVVPVLIDGTEQSMPPGKALPQLQPIRIAFAEPINGEVLAAEGEGDERHDRISHALQQRISAMRKPGDQS